MDSLFIKLATLFGIGRIPWAPGTWGSLVSLPLCYACLKVGPFFQMGITLVVIILAIVAAEHFERQSHQHDSKEVVIDEMAGMMVTMTWLPISWQSFLLSFVVFRFLDIVKPFPISFFDRRVPGGFGVVADDVVAGVLGNILLQLVLSYTSWLGVQIQLVG